MVIANSHSETHSCIVGLRSLKHWRHTRTASRQQPAETDESDNLAYLENGFWQSLQFQTTEREGLRVPIKVGVAGSSDDSQNLQSLKRFDHKILFYLFRNM